MAKLQFFNYVKGLNSAVSPFLQPQGSLTILNGVNHCYKVGALLKDLGYSRKSTQIQANKAVTGLFDFQQDASTQKMLATINDATDDDTQLFYMAPAGAWTEIGAAETAWANFASITVEMEQFIGYCFFVGYGATDGFLPVGSLTGTTFSTVTNVTSMPKAKFIKRFRDRLYIANCQIGSTNYPYSVFFSSVPSAGAITWTVATDFFDVDFNLDITGLGATYDFLFVFTREATFIYDQSQKKEVWKYGCSNHRTVENYGSYMIWCTGDNIAVSTGGQPQLIGGEIIDFIRNGNAKNFIAKKIDDEYHLYIGSTSCNGISYTNLMATYNFTTNSWRTRELANTITSLARHFDNTNWDQRLYMGDSLGSVWDKSKYTDATIASSDSETTLGTAVTPIHSQFEVTIPFGSMSLTKGIDNFVAFANRAGGLRLKGRVVDRNNRALMEYTEIGELKEYLNAFSLDIEEGALFQIQGAESGVAPYWSFYGFEVDIEEGGEVAATSD